MSTTAGVGTQEYVAINVPAVVGLLIGFASILALLDKVLLAIPIVGVIVTLVALRQVRESNGTQTGRGFALGGLFLSVALGVFVLSTSVVEAVRTRNDKAALSTLCEQFGADLRDRKYDAAYALCSERFKSRVSRDTFVERFSGMQEQLTRMQQAQKLAQDGTPMGPINGAHWNGLAQFYTNTDTGTVTADAMFKFTFDGTDNEEVQQISARKVRDHWTIDNLAYIFPPPKGAAPR